MHCNTIFRRGASVLTLLTALLFITPLQMKADNEPDDVNLPAIKLQMSNGTSQLFLLKDNPVAKFEGNTLIISSNTTDMSVLLDGNTIVEVIYVDGVPTHIEKTEYHQVFRINDTYLEARGLEPKTTVILYDLKGVLLARAKVNSDGCAKIPINGKGIYVVKTSISSFKIKK